jgi:hypothetical protein
MGNASIDFGGRGAPDRGSQPGRKLRNGEGLGNVIVRPGVERFHLIHFPVPHREHQNLEVGSGPSKFPARCDPADARHVHIQQDRIDLTSFDVLNSLLSVRALRDIEP